MATKSKLLQVPLDEEIRGFIKDQLDEEITSMSRYIVSVLKKEKKRVERAK